MTWSPVSRWGAKVGLCLPRSRRATSVARRPSTMPSASTTCQARWISLSFGEYVDALVPRGETGGGANTSDAQAEGQGYGAKSRTANAGSGTVGGVVRRVAHLPQDEALGRRDAAR